MPILVNLRHLEKKPVQLDGALSSAELEIIHPDELMQVKEDLKYNLTVERNGPNLLVHGSLTLNLDCECAKCLKPFKHVIDLEPYDAFIPLEGEEKAKIENDCVDLTPYVREDILLAFPQHPLCRIDCSGLPKNQTFRAATEEKPSAWAELNKLKF